MKDILKKIEVKGNRKRTQRIILDVTPEMHNSLCNRILELKGIIVTTTEFVRSLSPEVMQQLFRETFGEIGKDTWEGFKNLPGDIELVLRSKVLKAKVES